MSVIMLVGRYLSAQSSHSAHIENRTKIKWSFSKQTNISERALGEGKM